MLTTAPAGFAGTVPKQVEAKPEAIQEVVYQATAYPGIGRVFPFLKAKNELFEARGIELPLKEQATTTPDEPSRYEGCEQAQVAAMPPPTCMWATTVPSSSRW